MSADMPPMERADFRLPSDLKAAVEARAERDGMTFSEYVRQALVVRLTWEAAMDAVAAGASPRRLADYQQVIAAFAKVLEDDE